MKHIKTYTLYERVSKETKVFESTEQDNSMKMYLTNLL